MKANLMNRIHEIRDGVLYDSDVAEVIYYRPEFVGLGSSPGHYFGRMPDGALFYSYISPYGKTLNLWYPIKYEATMIYKLIQHDGSDAALNKLGMEILPFIYGIKSTLDRDLIWRKDNILGSISLYWSKGRITRCRNIFGWRISKRLRHRKALYYMFGNPECARSNGSFWLLNYHSNFIALQEKDEECGQTTEKYE